MTQIPLPQYGMGMTDGTIIKWHVAVGDMVSKGQLLCEVEAAKTNVEFESPVSGKVTGILVEVDSNVPVNTPLLEVDEDAAAADSTSDDENPQPADTPAPDQALPPPSRSKASPLARRIAEQEDVDLDTINGSGPRGRIVCNDVREAAKGASNIEERKVQIEPRARKAAQDLGVDLGAVLGTGPGGRIVAEDVIAFAERSNEAAAAPDSASQQTELESGITEKKHSMMRRTIARRLTESKQTVPHFYLKTSCRIDALLAARKAINVEGQPRVSVNDFVIRAIANAFIEVPEANVTWDEKVMRHYDFIDIAVAVATPRGLVTPILRDAGNKPVRQIAKEVKDLAERGRAGKLMPEEYQGGTTSVSNLGMFGVEEFSAIINPPQSTIFAIGAGEERIVPIEGKPEIATMMSVTLSCDHRAIDGATGAQLLAAFKAIIQDPMRIIS